MGGLIPIGQGADAEIKDLLNKTFAGVNLDTLQNLYGTEKLFDKDHTLHRVAYRLGCFPKNKYSEPSRATWFYLLKTSLKTAKYNGFNTVDTIKSLLDYPRDPSHKLDPLVSIALEALAPSC